MAFTGHGTDWRLSVQSLLGDQPLWPPFTKQRRECEPNHPEEVLFPQKPPACQEWCPHFSRGQGLAMTQPLSQCHAVPGPGHHPITANSDHWMRKESTRASPNCWQPARSWISQRTPQLSRLPVWAGRVQQLIQGELQELSLPPSFPSTGQGPSTNHCLVSMRTVPGHMAASPE